MCVHACEHVCACVCTHACVCICVCEYACVCEHARACGTCICNAYVAMCRPEVDIICLFLSNLFPETASLTELRSHLSIHRDQLASKHQGPPVSASPALGLQVCTNVPSFLHGCWNLNSVIVQQSLYQLNQHSTLK